MVPPTKPAATVQKASVPISGGAPSTRDTSRRTATVSRPSGNITRTGSRSFPRILSRLSMQVSPPDGTRRAACAGPWPGAGRRSGPSWPHRPRRQRPPLCPAVAGAGIMGAICRGRTVSYDATRAAPCDDRYAGPPCGIRTCPYLLCLFAAESLLGRRRLEVVQLLGLFCRNQADRDQVERADEAVADPVAAGPRDGIAQRHGPGVLDEQERCGGVVGDLFDDVPGVFVAECLQTRRAGFRAGFGAGFRAGLAVDAEAEQRTDLAPQFDGLISGQVAQVLDLNLAAGVLVDGKRVDDTDRVTLAEFFQLGDDLAVEVGMIEPQDEHLDRTDGHVLPLLPLTGRRAKTTANELLSVTHPLPILVARDPRPPHPVRVVLDESTATAASLEAQT